MFDNFKPTRDVYESYSDSESISDRVFNIIFAATAAFGMFVYGIGAATFATTILGTWGFITLFIAAMVGVFFAASDVTPIKIIGLALCAGGLGAISGNYIHRFKIASVIEIAGTTVMLVLVLGAIGALFPGSLKNWGGMLLSALTALIVAQLLLPLVYAAMGLPLKGVTTLFDWIGVILFSGYTVFDFNQAQEGPRTVEAAINSGVSVYLDIANLFIRLLSLFGDISDD